MRLFILPSVLYLLCLCYWGNAQSVSVEDRQSMISLMDSSDFYGLKDPEKSRQFAKQILDRYPGHENDSFHVEAMLNIANSLKMQSRKADALNYARQAITLSAKIGEQELLMKSYFMKGSVFGQDDDKDSLLLASQKVIDLYKPGMNTYFIASAYG